MLATSITNLCCSWFGLEWLEYLLAEFCWNGMEWNLEGLNCVGRWSEWMEFQTPWNVSGIFEGRKNSYYLLFFTDSRTPINSRKLLELDRYRRIPIWSWPPLNIRSTVELVAGVAK